ncbi:hypothetical protein D3C72_1676050 [compost metagenome]
MVTPRSFESTLTASTTSEAARARSTRPKGAMCSFSSIRLSDSRSATSRPMRSAWMAMMSRNLSRALGSSLAWPFRVSMKPDREARGVRSS